MSSEMKPASPERIPDWQLPEGVDRPLWEYLQSPPIANDYDTFFADTRLMRLDREFLLQRFHKPGRMVDLGCGTGRLVVSFAERGFDVTGVDLSDNMLRVCDQKRKDLALSFRLEKANICDLSSLESETFDYSICMFSTLGMVVGVENRAAALREIHRITKPGGLFALHLHNKWFNVFDPQGRRWLLSDLFRRWRGDVDHGDKVQASYRGIPNLRLHLFTPSEIKRMLISSGFRLMELFPISTDQSRELQKSWIFPGIRSNGWLILAQRI
ncbi:class I SAM-dependent methyltransferase [bacterium]|nr:class I SAM-dependent methyltransferase [bacterium]